MRFLHSRSFQKTFAVAMVLLFVCAVPGWKRAVPERQCHWRFPAASMAPMAQNGGDGRWRHRAQACFLVALLYSSAPGGVVIGVSWSRSKAVVRFRSCR